MIVIAVVADANGRAAIANACYFNIGARLARYTANSTYADLATKTWDLVEKLGYISDKWDVYDGAHLPDCTDINKAQFSYNAAMLLQGAAFLYNYVSIPLPSQNMSLRNEASYEYPYPPTFLYPKPNLDLPLTYHKTDRRRADLERPYR